MAEKLLEHALKAEQNPLNKLKVISAGIAAYNGGPASENAKRALKACNLDLSEHKSQELTQEIIDESLAVFCMTNSHVEAVKHYFKTDDTHVHLVKEFLKNSDDNIQDPFGRALDAYEAARDSIVEAIPSLIEFLRKIHPKS